MRSTFDLDPSQDYGEATPAIRAIINEWTAVDWFVPVREKAAEIHAKRLLEEYNRLARIHLPDPFPETVAFRTVFGGWDDFASLCERVRPPSASWDWKYSALKVLCCQHSKARGWRLEDQKYCAPEIESHAARGNTGTLFWRHREHVMWAFYPKLDLEAAFRASPHRFWQRPKRYIENAGWYLSYANMDVSHCIEWQLAEKSARLDGNPFAPLMRCYAQGFLPFSLGRDELLMFAFGPEPPN